MTKITTVLSNKGHLGVFSNIGHFLIGHCDEKYRSFWPYNDHFGTEMASLVIAKDKLNSYCIKSAGSSTKVPGLKRWNSIVWTVHVKAFGSSTLFRTGNFRPVHLILDINWNSILELTKQNTELKTLLAAKPKERIVEKIVEKRIEVKVEVPVATGSPSEVVTPQPDACPEKMKSLEKSLSMQEELNKALLEEQKAAEKELEVLQADVLSLIKAKVQAREEAWIENDPIWPHLPHLTYIPKMSPIDSILPIFRKWPGLTLWFIKMTPFNLIRPKYHKWP